MSHYRSYKNIDYSLSLVILLLTFFLICSCTDDNESINDGDVDIDVESAEIDADMDQDADEQETTDIVDTSRGWMELVDQDTPDPEMTNISVTSEWEAFVPVDSYEGQPGYENAECYLQRFSRIAYVTIDGIVRDYGNPEFANDHKTVYQLTIHDTLSGGELPQTLFASTATGCYFCNDGSKNKSYPNAQRTRGESGIALLSSYGRDPIRGLALSGDAEAMRYIPARVMKFGVFFPEKADGSFDTSKESIFFKETIGDSITREELEQKIAAFGTVDECSGSVSVCMECGTAQACMGKGVSVPCVCTNELKGCEELKTEEAGYSRLYRP